MALDTHIHRLESRDFLEMEQALGGWDHRYQQVTPGRFRGGLLLTQTDSLGIFRNRWERAIHYQGTPPEGTVALVITLAQSGDGHWMGEPATVDDVIVQPRRAAGEYISASLWDSVVFTIPEVDLRERVADITRADPTDMLQRPRLAHLSPELGAEIRKASTSYLHAAAQSLVDPDASLLLSEMAQSTTELLTHALVSSRLTPELPGSTRRQRQLIAACAKRCNDRQDQPVRIEDLAHDLGVSERTLRYAFQVVTGAPPLTFLKRQRLNQAYRALLKADPAMTQVKGVALAHGFGHFGQFAHDYKHLFGEKPSQTLERR